MANPQSPVSDAYGPAAAAAPGPALALWRRHGPLLLLAIWLVLLAGWRPLSLPDEGRYGGVAFEMFASGDWLTPTLFGMPYFHKPPLMYWVDIAALHLLGPTALALRAAPLLGGWLMGLALWIEARRRGGDALARPALAVLAVLPMYFYGSQYANHDMLVAGWISLAIVAARQALDAALPSRAARLRWVVLAWAAAGLALLSKGLIGVVLPALVLAPGLILQRRWAGLRLLLHPLGLAVFLLLAMPWMLQMQRLYPEFFDYFVMEQHFRRYTQARFNNAQPWWFYLAVLPLATVPASLVLLPAGLRLPGLLRTAAAGWRHWAASPLAFDAWWVLAILLFFSMPRSKLVGYILPVLLPTALLLLAAWSGRRGARGVWLLSAAFCVAGVPALMQWGRPDHADLGHALRERLGPQDRVVLIAEPFFDLRLQAGLARPPAVLAPWERLRREGSDSWHRELTDAARFAADRGAQVLWTPERLAAARCEPGRLWLVAEPDNAAELPADAERVFTGRRGALYVLPRGSCP